MLYISVCLFITGVPGAFGDRKKASDSLGLKLQTRVNHHMVAGNQTQNFCHTSKHSKLLSCLSSPLSDFLTSKYIIKSVKNTY